MTTSIATIQWSEPKQINTKGGERNIRQTFLYPDHPAWSAWRFDKEAVKSAHFSLGKQYQGSGWELTHWESSPGQFTADASILEQIIARSQDAEVEAKQAQKIDYVAEHYEELTTAAASKLFDWQRPSCQRIVAALKTGNAIDASQTGAGKTYVALAACAELGLTPYIIAPLAVLESWRRASVFMGVEIGGVTNYDKARAGSSDFIFRNKEAKIKNGELAFSFVPPAAGQKALIIYDEAQKCFPYNTLIDTDHGLLPIGEIVDNKSPVNVFTWDFQSQKITLSPILNHWQNSPQSLISVEHEHGTINCTPDHKILTHKGWTKAKEVSAGDLLYVRSDAHVKGGQSIENMRVFVRSETTPHLATMPSETCGIMDDLPQKICSNNNGCELRRPVFYGEAHAKVDHQQPYAVARDGGESDSAKEREDISVEGRKWETDQATRGACSGGETSDGVWNRHTGRCEAVIPKPSEELQGGLGMPRGEVGNRGGRENAPTEEVEVLGQTQDCYLKPSRVVSVEILESGDRLRLGCGSEDDSLYDIEVAVHHNYFANGTLVHNCKGGTKTLQGRVMSDIALRGEKILILSATAAKDPTEMESSGIVLGLHDGGKAFTAWAKAHGCKSGSYGLGFTTNARAAADIMGRIHRKLFPARGSRIRSADVPGYPDNAVSAALINSQEIVSAYQDLEHDLSLLDDRIGSGDVDKQSAAAMGLAAMMKARRSSEKGKLDYFIDEAKELLADGQQVAIFLNFREHLAIIRDALKLRSEPVWGTAWLGKRQEIDHETGYVKMVDINGPSQTTTQRQQIIDDFQAGRSKVILVSLQAGGAGISLHDVNGIAPRQSLISPSYSAVDLVQAIGRIWRAGSHSKATQRIVYAAGTIEEEIAGSITAKIANIETLNDGDLRADSLNKFTHFNPASLV